MGKITKKKNKKESYAYYMVFIAPFTIVCILISFMIIQFLGEKYGFSPIIILQNGCLSCTSGELVVVFILMLSISIFIGLLISYTIIKIILKGE